MVSRGGGISIVDKREVYVLTAVRGRGATRESLIARSESNASAWWGEI